MIKRKKKSGFTLLELIIVLTILSTGIFIISPNLNVFSDSKAKIEMDHTVDGVIEFINTCKAYGRLKEKNVVIKFRDRDLVLMDSLKVVEKFKFPQTIIITSGDSIEINELGKIKKAHSINISSKNHHIESETITIKVGTAYVSSQKK